MFHKQSMIVKAYYIQLMLHGRMVTGSTTTDLILNKDFTAGRAFKTMTTFRPKYTEGAQQEKHSEL